MDVDLRTAELGHPFTHTELRSHFKAVWGGVAWPGKRPGFVVVIGMIHPDEPEGSEIYLLDEFESFDMRELIRQCGVLNSKYEPERWVGDTSNDSAEEFLGEMKHDFCSYLSETELTEMEPLYPYILGKFKELLNPERRRLFLKNSRVLDYLAGIEQAEVAELERGDYPALEALIYAVAELLQYRSMGFVQTHTGRFSKNDSSACLSWPGAIDRGLDFDDEDDQTHTH